MSYDADERDFAYVEHVLGLRKQDDAVALVRHNAMGLSCLGHLATDTSRVVLSAEEAAELLRVVPSSEWSSGPLVNLYPRLTGKTP
jgi:hypothetical protein